MYSIGAPLVSAPKVSSSQVALTPARQAGLDVRIPKGRKAELIACHAAAPSSGLFTLWSPLSHVFDVKNQLFPASSITGRVPSLVRQLLVND